MQDNEMEEDLEEEDLLDEEWEVREKTDAAEGQAPHAVRFSVSTIAPTQAVSALSVGCEATVALGNDTPACMGECVQVVTDEHVFGNQEVAGADNPSSALNFEIPSMAQGPLVVKDISELKGSDKTYELLGTGPSSVDKKVVKPMKSMTPISAQSTPLRRSIRMAASVDEDSLERVSRLVVKKNLEGHEGNFFQIIFLPFLMSI